MIYPFGLPEYTGVSVFNEEADWLHEQSLKMTSIVEIGSYRGRSTYALACDTEATVHAVDPWDGNNAYDLIFDKFLENTKNLKNVKHYKMYSLQASKLFSDRSIDMVFIDGDHGYASVKQDIALWLPKCTKLICGHDFVSGHPGVIKAVQESFVNYKTAGQCIWYCEL